MDEAQFWQMIDEARTAVPNKYEMVEYLAKKLAVLDVKEIFDYDTILHRVLIKAYKRDLWAAAIIINEGCSEDGFADFRGWLIAQGKAIFYKAVDDPNTLIEIADTVPSTEYGRIASLEHILYSAIDAYRLKTGQELRDIKEALNYFYISPDGDFEGFDYQALCQEFPLLASHFPTFYPDEPDN
jgi:hypothetical protein